MTAGQGIKVSFKCISRDRWPIAISGNIRELGNWISDDALMMQPQDSAQVDHHEWTAQATLQHGQTIEYKFMKLTENGVLWESGDNRRYTVIPGAHTISDSFRE